MRVFKKISTPFTQCRPDAALILVNMYDPQLPTVKVFINACKDYGIPYSVLANKSDLIKNYRQKAIQLGKRIGATVIPISVLKKINLKKAEKEIKKFPKGQRIAILGIFNAGKTSFINYFCQTKYKVGDLPGTTLEFTETPYAGRILIDSIGQLIDINKPLMVSIDFSDCHNRKEKISKVFSEEIRGITNTANNCQEYLDQVIEVLKRQLKKGKKIIVTGAGASALVAREIAGQGLETGLPILVFTNDMADSQPVSFSKGIGETEGGLSRYANFAVDLGDVVIGISASGGTGFVYRTLQLAKKKKAITVAITENIDTPLGKAAAYVIKSNAKPEGPSSSKIQTAHLVIGHCLILVLADERGIEAKKSVEFMLPEPVETKLMGIK